MARGVKLPVFVSDGVILDLSDLEDDIELNDCGVMYVNFRIVEFTYPLGDFSVVCSSGRFYLVNEKIEIVDKWIDEVKVFDMN